MCHTWLTCCIDTDFRSTSLIIPLEWEIDSIAFFCVSIFDIADRMIYFFYRVTLELAEECFEGVYVFGYEDTSSRLSIDAMDE